MMVARQQAQEAMKRAQELLGRKSDHRPYQKDQWVWLEGKHLQTTHPSVKMHPKHFGPFKVTDILGKTTYRLELPSHWKIHNTFHASLLLPYKETKEHGHNFTDPPLELIEGQEEWEVEQILDLRLYRQKRQYLIKWQGYSDAHNSWEPEGNVHAPDLLLAFQKWKEEDRPKERKLKTRTCPRNHLSSKKQTPQVPKECVFVIRALQLAQRGSATG
jgi:Chromo (CHRromatin Organisation MOdifier) domain